MSKTCVGHRNHKSLKVTNKKIQQLEQVVAVYFLGTVANTRFDQNAQAKEKKSEKLRFKENNNIAYKV